MVKRASVQTNKEMRAVYSETLYELMKTNPDIVVMDADLVSASGSGKLFKEYPDRCINMGISEANMMGAAAGMSLVGKIPFVHTFTPFATRRVYDQVYLSGAYQKANVRIFGSDPGFWASHNGGTHTSVEDVALMRAIPTMTVLAPADASAMKWVVEETSKHYGMFYIRAGRKSTPDIYDASQSFELGKAIVVQDGEDGVIFSMGEMIYEALLASESLKKSHQLSIAVVDMFSLKPLDEACVIHMIKDKKFVIVAENHSVIGGLGSAVAQVMAASGNCPPLRQVGIQDHFGEVGTVDYLQKKFKLKSEDIIESVMDMM